MIRLRARANRNRISLRTAISAIDMQEPRERELKAWSKSCETSIWTTVTRDRASGRKWAHPFTLIRRIFGNAVFSSLTRRILFFNLVALVVLVGGIMYLNQFREGLIDARVESLLTQGEIIAGAIAASASVDTNSITIDPEKLLELQAGQSITPLPSDEDLEFPINQERVAPVLRRLISPTRTRARLFDADADLLLDSRHLYTGGQVLRFDLPPIEPESATWSERLNSWFNRVLQPGNLPLYKEPPGGNGAIYPEVMNALTGVRGAVVRVTEKGELIVSVAVPVQRFRAVLGVLLLVDAGRRHRQDRSCRAAGHHPRLRRRSSGQRHPVPASVEHDRQPAAAPFSRRHPRAARRRQGARGNPGFLVPPGRDRQPLRRPSRDDDGALRPYRCDREFCRRRQP